MNWRPQNDAHCYINTRTNKYQSQLLHFHTSATEFQIILVKTADFIFLKMTSFLFKKNETRGRQRWHGKPVNTAVTPTPWGSVTPPASWPLGTLWQARACTPTWGRGTRWLPGDTDCSVLSHRSSDSAVTLPGSEREGHQNALDSGAGRGQAKLHSPVVHQVKLHISATHTKNLQWASRSLSYIFIMPTFGHSCKYSHLCAGIEIMNCIMLLKNKKMFPPKINS